MDCMSVGTTTHFPGREDLGEVSILVDGVEQPLYRLPGGELFVVSQPRCPYRVKMVVPQSGGEMEFVIFDTETDTTGHQQGAAIRGRLGTVLTGSGTFVLDKTGDIEGLPLTFSSGAGFIHSVLFFEERGGYSCDPFPMIESGAFLRGARLGDLKILYGRSSS